MEFERPLIAATLIRRYQRFFCDVRLADGSEATAHCPNTGSMLGVATPGAAVWLSEARNPRRRLPWTLEMISVDGGLVGINTQHPNRLVEEAILAEAIPDLSGYRSIRREVRYGTGSRIDLLLDGNGRPPAYVEVKNVHLRRPISEGAAEFPDCVTARGSKHLNELAAMVATGYRACLVFVVQRTDCRSFRVAADLDPAYAAGFAAACRSGVEVLCYSCSLSPTGIRLADRLPVCGRDVRWTG